MDAKSKTITFIAPSLPPSHEAAAVRVSSIIDNAPDDLQINCCELKGENRSTLIPLLSNKFPLPLRLLFEVLVGCELSLRLLFKRSDAYVVSTPPYFASLIVSLCLALRGKRYALDVRDIYPEVLFNSGVIKSDSFIGNLLVKLTCYIYGKSALITTVTEGCKSSILQIASNSALNEGSVSVIRNGFLEREFTLSNNTERSPSFSVVFHGLIGRFQNPQLIIDVAKELPQVEFTVIGHGPSESIIQTSDLSNLKFLGSLPHQDIPKTIAKAHLGISPRDDSKISKDSLPVKVFEYIGVGIPIIATPKGEVGQIIDQHDLGLNCENDKKQVIQFIEKCIADPSFYQQLCDNVRNARKEFSREKQASTFWSQVIPKLF
jgi:glycosyltransferase involved in cell wall biosynthesis